jgi:hypothetical protein
VVAMEEPEEVPPWFQTRCGGGLERGEKGQHIQEREGSFLVCLFPSVEAFCFCIEIILRLT